MLKKIFVGLLLIVAVFALVVATQPEDFIITRSVATLASPAALFEQINDFSKWTNWSPWEKLDKDLKRTYEGPQSGVGAIYKWVGNDSVGEGQMTIVQSHPNDMIKIKLNFIKPRACVNDVFFTFTTEGEHTRVTWTMSGKNDFVGKAFHLLIDIGKEFDKGLADLKKTVEAPAVAL